MQKTLRNIIVTIIGIERYESLKYWFFRTFFQSSGYSKQYYLRHIQSNQHCYPIFAKGIMEEFRPASVVDVGCGSGKISLELRRFGCVEVHGFDYSAEAIKLAIENGLENATQLDLTAVKEIPAHGDLCICLEVLEHIPEKFAKRVVSLLVEVAPVLVVSAATPGQVGFLHVNLKPRGYWIKLFEDSGFFMILIALKGFALSSQGELSKITATI